MYGREQKKKNNGAIDFTIPAKQKMPFRLAYSLYGRRKILRRINTSVTFKILFVPLEGVM